MSRLLGEIPQEDHATWREIEDLIARMDELSNTVIPLRDFFKQLVDETVRAVDGAGGAMWLASAASRAEPIYQLNLWNPQSSQATAADMHRQLVAAVIHDGKQECVAPNEATTLADQPVNSSGSLLCLVPIRLERRIVGVLELAQRPTDNLAARRGTMRLLAIMGEFAAHYLLRAELQQLRASRALWQQFRVFACEVHASLDLRETAFRVVNEGQRVVGCDRLSLLTPRGRRCRLIAVSGADTVDRRANAVRSLEKLASVVAKTRDGLSYPDEQTEHAPEISARLDEHVDCSHTRMLHAVPLTRAVARTRRSADASQVIGVLVAERFDADRGSFSRQGMELVAAQASAALGNALDARGVLRQSRSRTSTWDGFRVLRWLLPSIAASGFIVVSLTQTAGFRVPAPGKLQPEQCRDVFAPVDGEVVRVLVKHDQRVSAGDELLVLKSPQLEMDMQRTEGESQATRQRLWATESAQIQATPESQVDLARLAAQQEELQQRLRNQQVQLELLQDQSEKLTVRSPVDGVILTWDVQTLLSNRPVQRGEALIRVGNVDGPWIAELEVPDDRVGHILTAQQEAGPHRDVSFELATRRGVEHQGHMESISGRTEINEKGQAIAMVAVRVDPDTIPDLRAGATISARIHCGRKSLAYVWFHDVIDVIRQWLTI